MKIVSENYKSVSVLNMQDGDVAIITDKGGTTLEIGQLVQRYKTNLVVLGKDYGKSYNECFYRKSFSPEVEILKPGTKITVII